MNSSERCLPVEQSNTTPLARLARVLEIFIPAYMFGKSWGIADEKTVGLFRAEFPPFLIDMAEAIKHTLPTDNPSLGRLVATSAGAVVGFVIVALLALVMHWVLSDRRYIDSMRFTAVIMIPIAVLNGTLSHAVKTLVESLGSASVETLTRSALYSPWGFFVLNGLFFVTGMWMMARRTGVQRRRRLAVVSVGLGFLGLYVACGLMITPSEWAELLPELQKAFAS